MKFKVGDLVRVKAGICHNNMHCCYYSFIVLKPYEGKISFISEINRFGQYVIESNRSILFDEDMLEKATIEMVKEQFFPDENIKQEKTDMLSIYNAASDDEKEKMRELFKYIENINNKAKPAFPVLKKWYESTLVVMFIEEKSGFVISGDADWDIGAYESSWIIYTDKRWEDFKGEIILSNQTLWQ